MRPQDFESQLRQQPLRPIPAEWREQILSEARKAQAAGRPCVTPDRSVALTLISLLRSLLWPSPAAWAGLASIWILLFGLNYSSTDKPRSLATRGPLPGREMILTLREQERVLTELIGPFEAPVADRKRNSLSRPRSQVHNEPLMG